MISTAEPGRARVRRAIGLMSGTSIDGIDAAYIETDGENIVRTGVSLTVPYKKILRNRIRSLLGGAPRDKVRPVERAMTEAHAEAVRALLAEAKLPARAIDVVGFHGHTILHDPHKGRTWQIGDGALLTRLVGCPVVADFRAMDVAGGGEGAPLVPLFHLALSADLFRPIAILNIGGVANVTWLGGDSGEILAFDTGPGNAPLDDWILTRTGQAYDANGALAASGKVDEATIARVLGHDYFSRVPPKSLDRDQFGTIASNNWSDADGAATLAHLVAACVARGAEHLPEKPVMWLVCGGGRHNPAIMAALSARLGVPVEPCESVGWNGDALEAQAFGYLAVRSMLGKPLSLPETTGVSRPMSGGRLFVPDL